MNGFLASHWPSVVELNHRVRLKQGGHAIDVTCVLSNYQLPLQFLGIVVRFSSGKITNHDTLQNVVDLPEFIVLSRRRNEAGLRLSPPSRWRGPPLPTSKGLALPTRAP